jgi:Flp pilus assembly protein CpaB
MNNWTPVKLVVAIFLAVEILTSMYVAKKIRGDVAASVGGKDIPRRITTRTVPMAATDLKPGTVITTHDVGHGPWPANEINGDVLLGTPFIVGRVVKDEIKAAYPIRASSLYRLGEYSKEYIGVP